ncbi:hypothetical protein OGAPHI_001337 [Ogataea philodendri]|uniref:Hydantoinase n=1 Tax=Ogataea philodendri TaxID=1378263 RepID=A0A9P8T8P8_9ASCO|nr:uncharacterized protein OGAPHI_001337 [Ogataea philodendri]KAH3669216.1 hypothetical protein OGAPHI_001337 [Ogataea philodendri]
MSMAGKLLIGVDVGGTNTDSVLMNPLALDSPNRGVLAWNKSATTSDVSDGIQKAIMSLMSDCPEIEKSHIASVTIGTTHFINAVIEQDEAKLEKVAVLRLSTNYSKYAPPFSDFPGGLRSVMEGYSAILTGGNRIDGNEVRPLDEEAVKTHAFKIKELGINAIVITGQFSPMYPAQEERAAAIIRKILPKANIVLSHTISTIGFIEREDASILNASIMTFARKIILSFKDAMKQIGLHCPVLLTQNDGTVVSTSEAMRTPVKTFSSGATNSMRGAATLCAKEKSIHGKPVIVADIGGTTTDVGLLLPSGFPRQSSAYSFIAGVRTNFSMPHVESIGLGGGSVVRIGNDVTIGPESTGAKILTEGLVFGGKTVTATDVTCAIGMEDDSIKDKELFGVGDFSKVKGKFSKDVKQKFSSELKKMLEAVIDRMKTSADPIPVVLVGGGSLIAPPELEGASSVFRPPFFGVVNAIGAAIGKVSASVQAIKKLDPTDSKDEILAGLKESAIAKAVSKGALKDSLVFDNIVANPIPYVPNTIQFIVKVIGDVDYHSMKYSQPIDNDDHDSEKSGGSVAKNSTFSSQKIIEHEVKFDVNSYKPFINTQGEWILSEVDCEFLRIGVYILGCGGGGTPYHYFLALRNMVRSGKLVRIIRPQDFHKYQQGDGAITAVGYAGSPTVGLEQLSGDEMIHAYDLIKKHTDVLPQASLPWEIGGGNGLTGLKIAGDLGIPCIDADFMGRAYPLLWQMIPVCYSTTPCFPPCALSDGNGTTLLLSEAISDVIVEQVFRASLSEIGAHCAMVSFMNGKDISDKSIFNTTSLAWRVGRAVHEARQNSEVEKLPEYIINACGGSKTAEKIFSGKIIRVERRTFKGHVYGEIDVKSEDSDSVMTIPFKNENIYCEVNQNGKKKVVASVPDLISVNDKETGEGLGTQDYRYGLHVFVIAICPSTKWTDTAEALKSGGPSAFGYEFGYESVGTYVAPFSVIDEYR